VVDGVAKGVALEVALETGMRIGRGSELLSGKVHLVATFQFQEIAKMDIWQSCRCVLRPKSVGIYAPGVPIVGVDEEYLAASRQGASQPNPAPNDGESNAATGGERMSFNAEEGMWEVVDPSEGIGAKAHKHRRKGFPDRILPLESVTKVFRKPDSPVPAFCIVVRERSRRPYVFRANDEGEVGVWVDTLLQLCEEERLRLARWKPEHVERSPTTEPVQGQK